MTTLKVIMIIFALSNPNEASGGGMTSIEFNDMTTCRKVASSILNSISSRRTKATTVICIDPNTGESDQISRSDSR